jgi:hypothetical protein
MSSDAVADAQASATTRHALRIAGGIAVPLVVGELLDWDLPFIASVFAVLLLATPQPPMKVGAGVASVLGMAAVFFFALVLTHLTLATPATFIVGFGIAVFCGLYGQLRSTSPLWFFFLVAIMVTPLMANQTDGLATTVAGIMVAAMAVAVLTTWLMHAAFPAPVTATRTAPATPAVASPATDDARKALAGTLILVPLMLFLLSRESAALVVTMTVLSILRTAGSAQSTRAVLGILLGNLIAGGIAMVAYYLIDTGSSVPMLVAIVLAVALFFGERIASGGQAAALYSGAAIAALVLLGLGLSPFNDASTAFATRVTYVILASLYALALIALLGSLYAARDSQAQGRDAAALENPAP